MAGSSGRVDCACGLCDGRDCGSCTYLSLLSGVRMLLLGCTMLPPVGRECGRCRCSCCFSLRSCRNTTSFCRMHYVVLGVHLGARSDGACILVPDILVPELSVQDADYSAIGARRPHLEGVVHALRSGVRRVLGTPASSVPPARLEPTMKLYTTEAAISQSGPRVRARDEAAEEWLGAVARRRQVEDHRAADVGLGGQLVGVDHLVATTRRSPYLSPAAASAQSMQ